MDIFDQIEEQEQGISQPPAHQPTGGDIFDQIAAQEQQAAPQPTPQVSPTQEDPGFDWREATRSTLEGIGALGGSVVGGMTAGPPGAVGGGALGYAAGRELSDIVLGEEPEDLGTELLQAGENVYEGLIAEALGLVGGKLLTGAGRILFRGGKLAKKGSDFAMNQVRRLRSAQKLDVPVTLGEALDSQILLESEDLFRDLAVPRVVPGAKFQKFDETGFKSLINARSNLIRKSSKRYDPNDMPRIEDLGRQIQSKVEQLFAGKVNAKGEVMDKLRNEALQHYGSAESFESLSKTGQEILESKQLEFEDLANQWFKKGSDSLPASGEDIVPTPRIRKSLQKATIEAEKLGTTEREPVMNLLNRLKEDYTTTIPGAPEIPESMVLTEKGVPFRPAQPATAPTYEPAISYNKLINRRSSLGAATRALETPVGIPGQATVVVGGKKLSRIFKPIQKALDDDIANFARSIGSDVDRSVRNGLSISKRKFDFVKNPAIKQLMRSRPEQFLDVLLKPNQIDTIKLLTNEFTSGELEPLRKVTVSRLLNAGSDEILTASALNKNIKQAGEGTLRNLLGADDFNQMVDLRRKLMAHERGVARMQLSGTTPKQLGLTETDLAGNKFFKQLVRGQKPQNILNLVYQKGNTTNVKRTYAALRSVGQHQKVQDLKASLIEDLLPLDPKTGFINLKDAHRNIKNLGDDVLKAAFSEAEYKGMQEINDVINLLERRKPGGSSISIFRRAFIETTEPVTAPMAWAYLRADGRNQLKKLLRLYVDEATREAKNAAMTKLIAIGTKAMQQSQEREKRQNGIQR